MAMQVSWIDAERIKALVALISPEETSTEKAPGGVEIHTTAEALQGSEAATWGFGMDWMAPVLPDFKPAPITAEVEVAAPGVAEPTESQFAIAAESADDLHEESQQDPAGELPLSRIRDKLRAIRQRASEAGILTRMNEVPAAPEPKTAGISFPVDEVRSEAVAASAGRDVMAEVVAKETVSAFSKALPLAPAFVIPTGSRDVRLAAFAGWARRVLREDGGHVLVMSDDGEVLWGGEAKAGLVLSTMMACGAAIRASAMSVCETPPVIHQPLASGTVLTVIPCETSGGMVHAAVAAPAGLTHEQAELLRGALCAAMQ
jgi:hypothetical protein